MLVFRGVYQKHAGQAEASKDHQALDEAPEIPMGVLLKSTNHQFSNFYITPFTNSYCVIVFAG